MVDAERLHSLVLEAALALPGAEQYVFAEHWDAIRVCGKWFALLSALEVPIVNLKVDPLDGQALRQTYSEITPGHHMNKRHWITLRPGPGLDEELVRELVLESYLLVLEGVPKAERPVDLAEYRGPTHPS